MSPSRDNHYVPQWYQAGFFEPGEQKYAYVDLAPPQTILADGRVKPRKARFRSATSQCFRQRDLYSTFFGTAVNDEIERRLFGDIDSKGAIAVRAFAATDQSEWVQNFEHFYTYLDAQKLRTPKGLDWLRAQYPLLDQNELMEEMQGIRTMHCAIWTGGVREIVSAEDSAVKFIVTDHPVTTYNFALPPDDSLCAYPNDPDIALKASQTIFPLNRDFCLILTNLEYAKNPNTNPVEKRTFPRNFTRALVAAHALIRERKLSALEVAQVNYVLKRRAIRYVAAGREEWLNPEDALGAVAWSDVKQTLLPPKDSLWHFGGEIFAKYNDGHVHYQDAFGRTEKQWDFLTKSTDERTMRAGAACGCGSGVAYRDCCKLRPIKMRPSWSARSIRERNLFLYRAIVKELELETQKDWADIRAALSDEQIKRLYELFAILWPRETDILDLLPKPDGRARALYTGPIHPATIADFALGASLYFSEVLIEHPFINASAMNKKYSPVENPRAYRQEFLKAVVFLIAVMPLVDIGRVNLVPDPCSFDPHLQSQMMHMAQQRAAGFKVDPSKDQRLQRLQREDVKRGLLALSPEMLRQQVRRAAPSISDEELTRTLAGIELERRNDPLAVLQEGSFDGAEGGGFLNILKLAPNFEMTLYLAQATGATIITDSAVRWEELRRAVPYRPGKPPDVLRALSAKIDGAAIWVPRAPEAIWRIASSAAGCGMPPIFRDAFRYALGATTHDSKPNVEANISARFERQNVALQAAVKKSGGALSGGRLHCLIPWGGIQHNPVNRLLLMSSSQHHLASAPMAIRFELKV